MKLTSERTNGRTVRLVLTAGSLLTLLPSFLLITNWSHISSSTVFGLTWSDTAGRVERIQADRQQHMRRVCTLWNDSYTHTGTVLIVNHQQRLLYCVVGKSACTSWVRTLLQLTGNSAARQVAESDRESVHTTFRLYLTAAKFPNASQIKDYLDYYKFLFVREPLERLLSAYRDKMSRSVEYIHVRQYIVRKYRRHALSRSLRTSYDVTFSEFVRYVVDQVQYGLQSIDHHWRPQFNLCSPCHLHYDFIGHYETLADDARHVLSTLASRLAALPYSSPASVRFPHSDWNSHSESSHRLLDRYYANVSVQQTLALLRLYRQDYEIFGYDIPPVIRRKLARYSSNSE